MTDTPEHTDTPKYTDTPDQGQAARRARHARIRAEVAPEEAETAEAEAATNAAALVVPLHLRIDRDLDTQLRQLADTEHIPTSALVRRLLRRAVQTTPTATPTAALTEATVEDIARRVTREELRTPADHRPALTVRRPMQASEDRAARPVGRPGHVG